MGNTPAFQFYPRQWLGDDNVMLMDWDARAMHLHLMCIAWQQHPPCTLPNDDSKLRRWIGSPPDWDERLRDQILAAWSLEDGRWVQRGLLREYRKQKETREKRQKAARLRWEKEHGKSADAGQMQSICNADAGQCSSSSSSSSSADKKNRPARKRFTPPTVAEVRTLCADKGYTFDPEAFIAHYTANGWRVGRNPMKCWMSACVTWQKREGSPKASHAGATPDHHGMWSPADEAAHSDDPRWGEYTESMIDWQGAGDRPRFEEWVGA